MNVEDGSTSGLVPNTPDPPLNTQNTLVRF